MQHERSGHKDHDRGNDVVQDLDFGIYADGETERFTRVGSQPRDDRGPAECQCRRARRKSGAGAERLVRVSSRRATLSDRGCGGPRLLPALALWTSVVQAQRPIPRCSIAGR